MKGKNGLKLDEKCTTGLNGEPFLISNDLVFPFDSIQDVMSIRVSFNSEARSPESTFGVVRTLIVEGFPNTGSKSIFYCSVVQKVKSKSIFSKLEHVKHSVGPFGPKMAYQGFLCC